VDVVLFTPTGLLIQEALVSKVILVTPPVTPVVTTTGNNNNGGGNVNEVCEEWSVCLDGTQTQSCNDGVVIKTRDCTELVLSNETASGDLNQTEEREGFFSPITGAVIGAFEGTSRYYWTGGLILLLVLILLWVIFRKKLAAKKPKKKKTAKKN